MPDSSFHESEHQAAALNDRTAEATAFAIILQLFRNEFTTFGHSRTMLAAAFAACAL
jgi:hypothetical protein